MGKHELPVGKGEYVRIGQQGDAAGGGELAVQQKIAVAMLAMDAQTAVAGFTQGGDDGGVRRIVAVVVSDPGLEEIAEDVKCFGLPGRAAQVSQKQRCRPGALGRQVQVGDEMDQGVSFSTISAFSITTSSTGTSW